MGILDEAILVSKYGAKYLQAKRAGIPLTFMAQFGTIAQLCHRIN